MSSNEILSLDSTSRQENSAACKSYDNLVRQLNNITKKLCEPSTHQEKFRDYDDEGDFLTQKYMREIFYEFDE